MQIIIINYLTGFLESGPQFVLQSYILMIGQKRNTNIDFNDIKKEDATRLGTRLDVMMFTLSNININFQPYWASLSWSPSSAWSRRPSKSMFLILMRGEKTNSTRKTSLISNCLLFSSHFSVFSLDCSGWSFFQWTIIDKVHLRCSYQPCEKPKISFVSAFCFSESSSTLSMLNVNH